jgi:uncharacterized membrane protein
MNKGRLEAFSDGVFSVVITLLIFDIKVPTLPEPVTNATLWHALAILSPLLIVYFITFAVLSVIWINHHFLFHRFAKSVDRRLNLLNLSYLAFVAFVPFSAHLIGNYHQLQPAAIIYGLNLVIIVAISRRMVNYMMANKGELLNDHLSPRLIKQARFRSSISLFSYIIGIIVSYVSVPLTLFFFAFPVIFNITPGSLDFVEHLFNLNLD